MKITTKDIIKFLPLRAEFKNKLLEEFDTMELNRKFEIEQMLWDVYNSLFEIKVQEKLELLIEKAKNNEIPLDNTLYRKAEAEAEKEMEAGFFKEATDTDLSAVRTKLEALMKPN